MRAARFAIFITLMSMCITSALFAQGITSAQCQFQINDAYGQPASNVDVMLDLEIPATGDDPNQPSTVETYGSTDASGYVFLSISAESGYKRAACTATPESAGYRTYGGSTRLITTTNGATLSGNVIVIPKPVSTIDLAGGGTADLYQQGGYDKPIVIAQPFNSAETVNGRFSASDLWMQYNGDPRVLSGGGMLVRLFQLGYDVWLVRPHLVGDDLDLQAQDYARAVQNASSWYGGNVAVAGYSMGGLVVRIAMSKWNAYGYGGAPPVNLIVALDSPLRGALVSNDLQHAFWNASFDNGTSAHQHNMDSCAAQQMLENACHKVVGCPDCLECNDRGWYETFYGGNAFTFCNPSQGSCDWGGAGVKTCSGVAVLNQPNGGWPAGIKKIAASLGRFGERTGVCYGDATGLDTTGSGYDGCPAVDAATFDTGTEWGYLDIAFSTDREFYYRQLNSAGSPDRYHWIDELTPGSRQPGSVEDVASSWWIFKTLNGHQWLHMGTFLPLYSALDRDPSSGGIPFDEYWTNSYSAFHDALSDRAGTWVSQLTGTSGSLSLVDWMIRNLDSAFGGGSSGCPEASCVAAQGAYISHYTESNCTGTESYYLPYDNYGYSCRPWDGTGQCGTIQRTVTNISYRYQGVCYNAWPDGNTLSQFVTVYR